MKSCLQNLGGGGGGEIQRETDRKKKKKVRQFTSLPLCVQFTFALCFFQLTILSVLSATSKTLSPLKGLSQVSSQGVSEKEDVGPT